MKALSEKTLVTRAAGGFCPYCESGAIETDARLYAADELVGFDQHCLHCGSCWKKTWEDGDTRIIGVIIRRRRR